jgi:hypothetical protein
MWNNFLWITLPILAATLITVNFGGLIFVYIRQRKLEQKAEAEKHPAPLMFGPSQPRQKQEVIERKVLDHELAAVLIRELFRIRKKITDNTFTMENLTPSLSRLDDELKSRGYVVRDLTGMPYTEGMRVSVVNFIPSETVSSGKEKIIRTIRPEISYKNKLLDPGTVEVAVAQKVEPNIQNSNPLTRSLS